MKTTSNKGAASRRALVWPALLLVAGGAAAWETLRDRGPARPLAVAVAPARQVDAPPTPPSPPRPAALEPAVDNARMPPAMLAAFDAWLIETYKQCWSPPRTAPQGDPYLPRVRVAFKTDGALAAPPKLVNPPADPEGKAHADAAMRAVKACDPLHVPEKYGPYYLQWKTKTVYFE